MECTTQYLLAHNSSQGTLCIRTVIPVHHVEHTHPCQCVRLLCGTLLFCSIVLLRALSGPTSSSELEGGHMCGAGSAAVTTLPFRNRPGLEAPLRLSSRLSERAWVASPRATPEARLAADLNSEMTPLCQAHQCMPPLVTRYFENTHFHMLTDCGHCFSCLLTAVCAPGGCRVSCCHLNPVPLKWLSTNF